MSILPAHWKDSGFAVCPFGKNTDGESQEVFHIKSGLTLLQPQEAWGEIDTWEAGAPGCLFAVAG